VILVVFPIVRLAKPKKGVILVVFPIVRLARPKKGVILVVFPIVRLASPKKGVISVVFTIVHLARPKKVVISVVFSIVCLNCSTVELLSTAVKKYLDFFFPYYCHNKSKYLNWFPNTLKYYIHSKSHIYCHYKKILSPDLCNKNEQVALFYS